jgi:outer membrane lipoprotein-sorting protein
MRLIFVLFTVALCLQGFPETGNAENFGLQPNSEKPGKFSKSGKSGKFGKKLKVQVGSVDARSKALLQELSKNYRSMKSMEAQVVVEMQGGPTAGTERRKGRLQLRGRKFRIDMGEQLIISDGHISWTYLKEMNEVNISNYETTPDQITPDHLFTLYEKGFDSFMESESGGDQDGTARIDLVPHNKSVSYFKVRLTINKGSRLVQKAVVFDKSGVQYTYSITGFKANPILKDDLFAFNPKEYPGVEIVDMR